MHLRRIAASLLALSLIACSTSPIVAGSDAPAAIVAPDWNGFVDRYIESYLAAHPADAVTKGRHEFDGALPDWSRQGIANEIARRRALRAEADGFPSAALTDTQRLQRDYLLAHIDGLLFWRDTANAPMRNPAFYFDWTSDTLDPAPYVTLTYAPAATRLKAITRYLRNIPRAAAQIRDNLGSAPLPPTFIDYGINGFGGLADFYRDELPKAFAEVNDAALVAEFNAARGPAITAMQGLREWLTSERSHATGDFALGAERFKQMLWATERVDIDVAELKAAGRAELARNLASLKRACDAYAPKQTLKACVANMNSKKPAGGPV